MRITIFEHQTLAVGEQGFTQKHFEAIVRFQDRQKQMYFRLGHKKLHFRQYVGVVRVGDLTIEILPKMDRQNLDNQEFVWCNILFEMLRLCRYVQKDSISHADLLLRRHTLLDLYADLFLQEIEFLQHQGLSKKYRSEEKNGLTLKGNILFSKHLSQNFIHQERFFTRHTVYSYDHVFHQILYRTMTLLRKTMPDLRGRIGKILVDFPEQTDFEVNEAIFQKLTWHRKTERYREAINLAKMILLNYHPDSRKGEDSVLALLFDMNQLFEETIFRLLAKTEGIEVSRQKTKIFWESESQNKKIRPDIILKINDLTFVLDTKWKRFDLKQIDQDLKQLYIYQHYFEAQTSYLLYPQSSENQGVIEGKFALPKMDQQNYYCHALFVNLFDDKHHLNKNLGNELIVYLKWFK